MFAGYDLFREGKIRRFWARQPGSPCRPRLLERLYPYLVRSPVSQRALAMQFCGADLSRPSARVFAHETRWRTTRGLRRLFSKAVQESTTGMDASSRFLEALPPELRRWTPLSQDQYLEIRTLLAG